MGVDRRPSGEYAGFVLFKRPRRCGRDVFGRRLFSHIRYLLLAVDTYVGERESTQRIILRNTGVHLNGVVINGFGTPLWDTPDP